MAAERPPRAAVRAAVRLALADLEPGDRVLVALSGGPDSLALLAATVRVAGEVGLPCGAVVVDHGLQEGSAGVAARAAQQARILGCAQVEVLAVGVPGGPGSGGVEAAARTARYAALRRAAADPPAAAVLLGHTRDDQAETVLLGLARGSGTRSLAGMAPRSGVFRRPLLDLPRALVERAIAEDAAQDPRLAPWRDPHNDDPAFARVRVRRDVVPALAGALGPGVVASLARTAHLARADADALDAWAGRVWAGQVGPVVAGAPVGSAPAAERGNGSALEGHFVPTFAGGVRAGLPVCVPVGVLTCDGADHLPAAVVSRLVRRLLIEAGCPAGALTAEHVHRVTDLLHGPPRPAEVALPGRRRARREGEHLAVRA